MPNTLSPRGRAAQATSPSLTPVDFIAGFVRGNSGNHYALSAGDATAAGGLKTVYNGPRPHGYETMRKQGAIILGIGCVLPQR